MLHKTSYIKPLTGLRAIAAYLVFIHHFLPFPQKNIFLRMLNETHIGVTFFFVLSGYLLTTRYQNTSFDYKDYLLKRLIRIFPMYLIILTAFYTYNTLYLNQSFTLIQVLRNVFLTKSFSNELKFEGIGQSWTLAVELVFYAMFPILLKISKKSQYNLILAILSGLTIAYALHIYFDLDLRFLLSYTVLGRLAEFIIGMVIAKVVFRNKLMNIPHLLLGFTGTMISLVLLALLQTATSYGDFNYFGILTNNFLLPIIGITPVLIGLTNSKKTLIGRFLSSPPLQLLGQSSYIFYLIHVGILNKIFTPSSYTLIVYFVIVNIVSLLLYIIVEVPISNYLKKVFHL